MPTDSRKPEWRVERRGRCLVLDNVPGSYFQTLRERSERRSQLTSNSLVYRQQGYQCINRVRTAKSLVLRVSYSASEVGGHKTETFSRATKRDTSLTYAWLLEANERLPGRQI